MKPLTCTTVRRHLAAYCDRELDLALHLAVRVHLGRRARHAAAKARKSRRSGARCASRRPRGGARGATTSPRVRNGVVGRFQAERAYSIAHGIERMIDDLRMLWAAAGATWQRRCASWRCSDSCG